MAARIVKNTGKFTSVESLKGKHVVYNGGVYEVVTADLVGDSEVLLSIQKDVKVCKFEIVNAEDVIFMGE